MHSRSRATCTRLSPVSVVCCSRIGTIPGAPLLSAHRQATTAAAAATAPCRVCLPVCWTAVGVKLTKLASYKFAIAMRELAYLLWHAATREWWELDGSWPEVWLNLVTLIHIT